MAVRSSVIDVAALSVYDVLPNSVVGFVPDYYIFEYEGVAGSVAYASFDGVTDHVSLEYDQASQTQRVAVRGQSVWVRNDNPHLVTALVRITAIRQM